MKAFLKDFIREFFKNKGRFISVFFIVLLGAAFFSGIRSSKNDMFASADKYYKKTKFMDLQIIGTLGLTDEDKKDIENIDGINTVEGGHTVEVISKKNSHSEDVKVIGITKEVNRYVLREGREPSNEKECMVDEKYLANTGYKIGDTITLLSGTDESLDKTLKHQKYKIVGVCVVPIYMDLHRGNATIGDGKLDSFIVVKSSVFKTDIYSELNIRVKETNKYNTYDDEYKKIADSYVKKIKSIADKACERRYNFIYSEAEKEINKAKKEISDAEEKLDDSRKKIDNGWKEIKKAKNTLISKEKELKQGKRTIESKERELKVASKTIESKESELKAASKTIESKEQEIKKNSQAIETKNKEINEGLALVLSNEEKLDVASKEIQDKEEQLALLKENILSNENTLVGLKALYDKSQKELLELKLTHDAMLPEAPEYSSLGETIRVGEENLVSLNEKIVLLETGLEQGKEQLSSGENEIEKVKLQLATSKNELLKNKEQLIYAKEEISKAIQQISSGKKELQKAKEQIVYGKSEIEKGKKDVLLGTKELEKARKQITLGEKELEKGKKQLDSKNDELLKATKKFEKEEKKAKKEITKGKEEIKDAIKELAEIEVPTWYVNTREDISSCKNYELDAIRVNSLGDVFPLLFFMVAALVSLTAMTRMVEEQRQQIGILKALGYGKRVIQCKYLCFALIPTLTGSLVGVLIGEKVMPLTIIHAYNMLYIGLTEIEIPYNIEQGSIAVIVCVACTCIATFSACYKATKTKASELMRPKAPKVGRRVLLERIFIWKYLSFSVKSTFRNIFRYKKRLFMTIIGVGGCMGLILVALGLKDSILTIGEQQFGRLTKYDATIYLDDKYSEEESKDIYDLVNKNDNVKDMLGVQYDTIQVKKGKLKKYAYRIIPSDRDRIKEYIVLNDRETHKVFDIKEKGVLLSEKTADELNVEVGDKIKLYKENEKEVEVEIKYIVENYLENYVYMSKEQYKELYKKDIGINEILLNLREKTSKAEKEFGKKMIKNKQFRAVIFTSDTKEVVNDMLDALTYVVYVLLVSAGLLAFVVIYNLNNINIAERYKELATLKVLGFYDEEVSNYVFRENIILTLMGVVAGLFIGTFLHEYVITSITMEGVMFGLDISRKSYILGAIVTILFTMFINVIMNKDLKKIDMIESLKSVE